MTERELAGLHGPVECIRTVPEQFGDVTTEWYLPDGQWRQKRRRTADGPEWVASRTFDEAGRVLTETRGLEAAPENFRYRYDPQGRLSQIEQTLGNAAVRVRESRLYHDGTPGSREDWLSTVTTYLDKVVPLNGETGAAVAYDPESLFHLCPDAVIAMTIQNARGNPVRQVFYDADERIIRRMSFRYDDRGRLLEEGEVERGTLVREDLVRRFEYNESNQPSKETVHLGPFGSVSRFITYDTHGNVIEHYVCRGSESSLEHTSEWITRTEYECDERGNWKLSRLTARNALTGDITEPQITRRTIRYW